MRDILERQTETRAAQVRVLTGFALTLLMALSGTLGPTRRAVKIDPITAIRAD